MMGNKHNLTQEKAIDTDLPSYRRHSKVINLGEDVLFEKICQSEENVSRRADYKRWETEY